MINNKNSEPEERLDYHGLSKFLDNLKTLFAFKADTPVKLSQLENDVGYKTTDTVYTHPSYAARSTGLYKVSVDGGGHVNSTAEVTKDDITKLGILSETPSFNDAVSTYTTLSDANAAAQTSSDAIKSGVSIFTTLSNMKKTFSAIVQGLKILGTNVGMIQGITSDLNAESDYIAASSKALHTLNSNLIGISAINFTKVQGNVFLGGNFSTSNVLFAVCTTKEYYVERLFKNLYDMWYVTLHNANGALVETPTDITLLVGYVPK